VNRAIFNHVFFALNKKACYVSQAAYDMPTVISTMDANGQGKLPDA
jgi:hypothetical protein